MNPKLPRFVVEDGSSLRLALCQIETQAWDCEGNLQRTLAALEAASAQGAHLAITPECVLHGYGFGPERDDTRRRLEAIAEPLTGPNVLRVREVARVKRMAIVLGFAERAGNAIHNSAAVVSATGDVLSVYRKVHCRTFEHIDHGGPFTPGDRLAAVDLTGDHPSFRMGTMICFDREMPESARRLRALGAQLIACPLACDTDRLDKHVDYANNEMITRCRAAENEVFIAVVNHSGRFNGGSFVVGPGGETLVQLGSGPEVRTLDIPVSAVCGALHAEPFGWMGWGYRRQDVYMGC